MDVENSYLNDAFVFSSKRRVLFVRLYQRICRHLGFEQISEDVVVRALEHIHASATIIDDMLDNDYLRKEIPSYYVRHGHPVAAFAALNLMIKGIELVGDNGKDLRKAVAIIRGMILAEEADVGLRRRDKSAAPLQWYRDVVSTKISWELLLILLLCSDGPAQSDQLCKLEAITRLLGQFIQYCDDWYDVLIRDPFAQNNKESGYVLTYSLPLAVYLQDTNDPVESMVGVKVDQVLAAEVMKKLTAKPNRLRVERFIEEAYGDLVQSLQRSKIPEWEELTEVAGAVKTEEYWERKYYDVA